MKKGKVKLSSGKNHYGELTNLCKVVKNNIEDFCILDVWCGRGIIQGRKDATSLISTGCTVSPQWHIYAFVPAGM